MGANRKTMLRRLGAILLAGGLVAGLAAAPVAVLAASTITVNALATDIADDGDCTLPEAVLAALQDLPSGATAGECIAGSESDVIVFDVSGTIHLTTATALPDLTSSVRIDGGGSITIDGSNEPGTGLCLCHNGASVSNLTIQAVDGTALLVDGFVGVRGVEVFANRQGITVEAGAGIALEDSTVHGNEGTSGSGIYVNEGGYAVITRSSIYTNSSSAEGGGIRMVGANVTVDRSTISGNGATKGAGIYMESPTGDSTLKVYNSTIADNVAGDQGGGIYRDGNVDIRNSTIARNTANTSGGGVITDGTGWTLALKNAVILGNTAGGAASDWANGLPDELKVNAVHSLVGLAGKTLGDYFSPVTLADHGGPTLTLKPKLVSGNPLIDGGDKDVCASDQIDGKDQRGFGRVSPCDIGAVDVDRTKPAVSGITAALRTGQTLSGSSSRATITWKASDTGSGPARYTIQRQVDGGSWSTLATGLTTKFYNVTLARTHDYRFRVRAIDHEGNVGSFATGPLFESRLYQQTSSAFVFSSTRWATSRADVFSGGSTRRSTASGASARFTATGRSFAWVTTTGPTRGTARIYVNGTLTDTVSLNAPTTTYRVQAWSRSYSSDVTRTIRIVVQGAARVDLDAFVVVR
jgi:hypothetical protein